jgi:hypothetical protein
VALTSPSTRRYRFFPTGSARIFDQLFHLRFDPEVGESAADFTYDYCRHLIRTAVGRSELKVELTQVTGFRQRKIEGVE